jgi:hypothetical protein
MRIIRGRQSWGHGISILDVEEAVLAINPEYDISYIDNTIARRDILKAVAK